MIDLAIEDTTSDPPPPPSDLDDAGMDKDEAMASELASLEDTVDPGVDADADDLVVVEEKINPSNKAEPRVEVGEDTIDEEGKARLSPLGIGAIGAGVVGVGLSFVLGPIALVVGIPGLVVGAIGAAKAFKTHETETKTPIAGAAICLIACVLSLVVGNSEPTSPTVEKPAEDSAAPVPPSEQPSVATSVGATPVVVVMDGPVSATQAVTVGEAQIRVSSARIASVEIHDRNTDRTEKSTDVVFVVTIEVSNLSETAILEYKTWAGQATGFSRNFGTLEDDKGNGCRRRIFGETATPVGRVDRVSIAPKQSTKDVLVFERPGADIKYVTLYLPGDNVGAIGEAAIRIPVDMIEH